MQHDIFISYASKDKKVADLVCSEIESNGFKCWIAPRNITPGKEWGEAIVDAINESKIMILIFSASSNNSQQVLREVERAVSKNVIIVPFRIEDTIPTKSMEYFLYSTHWFDALTDDVDKHIIDLVKVVTSLFESPEKFNNTKNSKHRNKDLKENKNSKENKIEIKKSTAALVGAILMALIIMGGVYAYTRNNSSNKNNVASVNKTIEGNRQKDIKNEKVKDGKNNTNIAQKQISKSKKEDNSGEKDAAKSKETANSENGENNKTNETDKGNSKSSKSKDVTSEKSNDTTASKSIAYSSKEKSSNKPKDKKLVKAKTDAAKKETSKVDNAETDKTVTNQKENSDNVKTENSKDTKQKSTSDKDIKKNETNNNNLENKKLEDKQLKDNQSKDNQLTEIKKGDYIKLGSYNGKPIEWLVINIDKSSNTPMLLARNVISMKPFDAAESGKYNKSKDGKSFDDYEYQDRSDRPKVYKKFSAKELREMKGSNNWINSNIREWLNSSSANVGYSTNPPIEAAVSGMWNGTFPANPYNQEAGFLSDFSDNDKKLIKTVKHKIILADADNSKKDGGSEIFSFLNHTSFSSALKNYDKAFYKNVDDKVFLLSVKEAVDFVYRGGFGDKVIPTAQAIQNDKSATYSGMYKDKQDGPYMWWLRDAVGQSPSDVCIVCEDADGIYNEYAVTSGIGVRPAICLKTSKLKVSGKGTSEEPYGLK